MKMRTEIHLSPFPFSINHEDQILLLGSCFTQNIGSKLKQHGFKTFENPYGISFNPISIAQQLIEIIELKTYKPSDLSLFQNLNISYKHHSSFSHFNLDEMLENINSNIVKANEFLKKSKVIFISLGTSWVWRQLESQEIVNNCHKVPNSNFIFEFCKQNIIAKAYHSMIISLNRAFPEIQIVFTVSPVRHWRNGAVNNSRSKSNLISFVHEMAEQYSNIHYFPSYEIMIDDLRDYRFYKDDLLHPSDLAVDYIWEKFEEAFFTKETLKINAEVKKVWSLKQHRPISQDNDVVSAHHKKLNEKLLLLKTDYNIQLS